MLSEAVREVEQIEPTNGELEGKLEEAPVLRENEGFSQGLNLADISIKEIKRNILEVYKEYFQRKEKGGGLLVASNDRSSYTAEELKHISIRMFRHGLCSICIWNRMNGNLMKI